MRKCAPVLLTTLLLAATPSTAQVSALDDPTLGGSGRYDNCLLLVRQDAQRALNAARDWQKAGGADAATHCAALALVALRRYAEAASTLDTMARDSTESARRAELYDQAGNAWLLDRRGDNAQVSFSAAITFAPRDADLLADRARAFALKSDWNGAENDLSAALALSPRRVDLLVLRASARHALGRKTDARSDVDQALALKPSDPDALELRGEMKMEAGDQAGARADWQAAVDQSPRSDAAAAARQRLNTLAAPANPPAKPKQ